MLYSLAHFLRNKIPWLWTMVERLNSCLFSLRYGRLLKNFRFSVLHVGYEIIPMCDVPCEKIADFFAEQPEEAFEFFKPHGFDVSSLKKLQHNKAFLAYLLVDESNGNIAGYCFNRSFFNGKGFRGRMVDINYRGNGLGTLMNKLLNDVGFGIGLRLFETVSRKNVASYRSALAASNVRVVEEMSDDELYLEILKD